MLRKIFFCEVFNGWFWNFSFIWNVRIFVQGFPFIFNNQQHQLSASHILENEKKSILLKTSRQSFSHENFKETMKAPAIFLVFLTDVFLRNSFEFCSKKIFLFYSSIRIKRIRRRFQPMRIFQVIIRRSIRII